MEDLQLLIHRKIGFFYSLSPNCGLYSLKSMIFSIIYPLVLYFPHYSLLLLLHILRDAIIFLSSGNVWLPDNDTRKIVQWETTHGFSKIFWVLENVGEEIEKLEHLCTIGEKIKCKMVSVQLSSVQSLSHVQLFVTP